MDHQKNRENLCGCYVTMPTMFRDDDLELNLPAMRRHVEFLIDGGIRTGTGVLLVCGAAGDFQTMTFEERMQATEAVIEAADGRVPVAMGAMTTSTRELVQLARAAEKIGAAYIQVSPPFYFNHTQGDFIEHFIAGAEAADISLILYNTFWYSMGVSLQAIEEIVDRPNFVGLKWATPDGGRMEFETAITRFADRLSIIDNQNRYVISHILGARAIEFHVANHWPEFGVKLWRLLEEKRYTEAEQGMVDVLMPYWQIWHEIEQEYIGDGYVDKLCMELVGLDSSRNRPPTRDIRGPYREKMREMLLACKTPRVRASDK